METLYNGFTDNEVELEMTRQTCKTLIADSKNAGFDVREQDGRTIINNGKLALAVYPNGAIHRADVRLDMAIRMRVIDAYSALRFRHLAASR